MLSATIPLSFVILELAHSFSMASEAGEADQDESVDDEESTPVKNGVSDGENADEGEASEEDEDEEPRLKYASLTKHLKPVYRNGDATSTFLVAGDKMVSRRLLQVLQLACITDSALDCGHTQWEHSKLRLD